MKNQRHDPFLVFRDLYSGIFGFFVTTGWSLGPLYGGMMLEEFGHNHLLAWTTIASLALLSGLGYLLFARKLPASLNAKDASV